MNEQGGGEEEGGEISPMCERIGHRPLRVAAQKGKEGKTENEKEYESKETE